MCAKPSTQPTQGRSRLKEMDRGLCVLHTIRAAVESQDQTAKQSGQGEGRVRQGDTSNPQITIGKRATDLRKLGHGKHSRNLRMQSGESRADWAQQGTHQQMGRSQRGPRQKLKLKVPRKGREGTQVPGSHGGVHL